MDEITGMLTKEEIGFAEKCLSKALGLGAAKARITLSKSLMELFGTLDGRLDKVSHCLDRSMSVALFVDGRFGSFSTNRLVDSELDAFLAKSVATVRMLAEDPCRDLPDPARTAKDALTGKELELYDPSYPALTSDERLRMAMEASVFKKHEAEGIISEEGEYSDSIYDTFVLDSNGIRCRHTETSFEYGVETTVKDSEGNRFSSYWWDSSPRLADLRISTCALSAYSLQQKNSFLLDSLGKKMFPEWFTLMDEPRTTGRTGSRLFDSEGVETKVSPVIENGVVKRYSVNTYMSRKMGIEPTVEDVIRPVVKPCVAPGMNSPATMDKDGIMALVRDGILVTGFNGGNSNSATGDFSFGVEGFLFRDGRVVHPVREMLITGNLLTLWNSLLAAGDDARLCKSRVIPTLAFKDVDFSA